MADRAVVIDASAAINAVLVEGAFTSWEHVTLKAPTLIWSEVAAGIAQLRWRAEITDDEAVAAIDRLLDAPIEAVDSSELIADAVGLSRRLGWAKTYDSEYVVLAQRLDAQLVTVDARLAAAVASLVAVVSPAAVAAGTQDDASVGPVAPPESEVTPPA